MCCRGSNLILSRAEQLEYCEIFVSFLQVSTPTCLILIDSYLTFDEKILGHSRDAVCFECLPEELLGRTVSETLQGECTFYQYFNIRLTQLKQAPVALCLWNQAGAEGKESLPCDFALPDLDLLLHQVVLLIRTYAFYNRNRYLFFGLCSGLAVVIVYQLFVTVNEMIRKHSISL